MRVSGGPDACAQVSVHPVLSLLDWAGGAVRGLSESTKEHLGKWMGYGLGSGLWLGSG